MGARVVSSVEGGELGIGKVVTEIAEKLIDVVSGPAGVPLCVVEIELSVDGQPPEFELELEAAVFSGLASDEDGAIVTVTWREMVVVEYVVVVEVVGEPLFV